MWCTITMYQSAIWSWKWHTVSIQVSQRLLLSQGSMTIEIVAQDVSFVMRFFHMIISPLTVICCSNGVFFKTKYVIYLQKSSGEGGVLQEMVKQVDSSGMTPMICACHQYSLWDVSWENWIWNWVWCIPKFREFWSDWE